MHLLFNKYKLRLREATIADVDAMLSIEHSINPKGWSREDFIASINSSHLCQVLVTQNTSPDIAAYIITSTAAGEAELLNIVVAPNYQRLGIAKQLLSYICSRFDTSIHSLFLEVRASNRAAFALYDGLGFNEVGLRPNYYPALSKSSATMREDAIIMVKTL